MRKELTVNGAQHEVDIDAPERLLTVLRDRLGLTGTKEACSVGECGACTVLIGGSAQQSCITLAARVDQDILTVEGLADLDTGLDVLFAEHGGFQCGFCTPGQMMSSYALVTRSATPGSRLTEEEIRAEMTGNICRCTGYVGIIRAVRAQLDNATDLNDQDSPQQAQS